MTNAGKKTEKRKGVYLHPLPVRIWHWINALGVVILILTGAQIRYVEMFGLMSFESAVKVHNWFGLAIVANYFLWLSYYLFSDRISNYHPMLKPKSYIKNFIKQATFYSHGIFKGEGRPHYVHPYEKFNPMQRMTYQVVMLITFPIQFITGLMLWDIKFFASWIEFVGGIRVVSTLHVLMFTMFTFFLLVHAYMGALGKKPSTHYKEMITGYEDPDGH